MEPFFLLLHLLVSSLHQMGVCILLLMVAVLQNHSYTTTKKLNARKVRYFCRHDITDLTISIKLTLQVYASKKFRQCYKKPHNLGKVPHVTELWSQERNVGGNNIYSVDVDLVARAET